MLLAVLSAVFRSRSLQAVHLCNNPGILDERVIKNCEILFDEKGQDIFEHKPVKKTLAQVLRKKIQQNLVAKAYEAEGLAENEAKDDLEAKGLDAISLTEMQMTGFKAP